MLIVEDIEGIMALKRAFEIRDGACFGTSDQSRLRPEDSGPIILADKNSDTQKEETT